MLRPSAFIAVLGLVALFALGCEGAVEEGPLSTPTPSPSPTLEPSPTTTPTPVGVAAPPGAIVVALSDFNDEIYTIAPDGSNVTTLTNTPEYTEAVPIWSPDGRRLAYIRWPLFQFNQAEIMVIDADGGEPRRLASGTDIAPFQRLSWSPDGAKIAFVDGGAGLSYRYALDCDDQPPLRLFLADVPTATSTQLLELRAPDGCPIISNQPQWSPDGAKIALASRGVYLVDVASQQLTQIVAPTNATAVAWAPHGQRLALISSNPPAGESRIFRVGADGSGLTELARVDSVATHSLAWSPQGSLIAFVAQAEGASFRTDLFVINADGSGLRTLAQDVEGDFAWSPDGSRIALTKASDDSQSDIYVVEADGSGLERITDHPAQEWWLAWAPDGEAIAFASSRDGLGGIYALQPDGSLTPLVRTYDGEPPQALLSPQGRVMVAAEGFIQTDDFGGPFYGPLSPDGLRAAGDFPTGSLYTEECASDANDIYVMNADGSHITNITNTPAISEEGPVWSPDSDLLAFTSWTSAGQTCGGSRLEIMKADGSGRRLLADFPVAGVWNPQWSPDGNRLFFNVGYSSIYAINVDGSGLKQILEFPYQYIFRWLLSPAADRLAVVVETKTDGGVGLGDVTLFVATSDGTDLREAGRGGSSHLSWSADSSRLAFVGCEGDPCQGALFVVNADGSDLHKLLENPPISYDSPLIWSPDGSRLAFVTNPEPCGYAEGLPPGYLEVINVDGSGQQRLTDRCIVRRILGWLP